MGVFENSIEQRNIREILERNNLRETEIFFTDCIYIDENDKPIELLSVYLEWGNLTFKLDIDGEITKYSKPPMPIVTLCYLKLQTFERNCKNLVD
jgi:hypothetical protein